MVLKCMRCGKEFKTNNSLRKYCSRECAKGPYKTQQSKSVKSYKDYRKESNAKYFEDVSRMNRSYGKYRTALALYEHDKEALRDSDLSPKEYQIALRALANKYNV